MADIRVDEFVEGSALYRIIALVVLALLLGTLASLGAIAFVEGVRLINDAVLVSPRARILYERSPLLIGALTVAVPTIGGLLVGILIQKVSDTKRPLGPADAIGAVQTRKPLPSIRAGLTSTFAALISLGCGASVGQYGPMVYLGALAGGAAARLGLPIRNLQAIAISCGVAAAISTAFNAPIAGLVFAHEVILRHYSIQAFAPTTVASATGYVIANVIFNRPPLFLVSFDGVGYGHEFILFAVLGALAAFLAILFMKCILEFTQRANQSAMPAILRPAFAGLCVGLVGLVLPDVLGIGQEALRFATIEGAFQSWELVLIVVAKIVVTALCIGFGFAGGVFSPALLIGVLFGALFWGTISDLTPVPTSGVVVYAVCGMMALSSPVIGAPLTTILIVFELTRNYDLTIAAMVSVVFANLIAYRVFGRSLFDFQLANRGIDLSIGRDRARLASESIAGLAGDDFQKCAPDEPVRAVLHRLARSGRAEAACLDPDGRFLGLVHAQDAWGKDDHPVADIVTPAEVIFSEQTTLWRAMREIEHFVGDAVPVVSTDDNRLLGMIAEKDLISAYLDAIRDLRREENETI